MSAPASRQLLAAVVLAMVTGSVHAASPDPDVAPPERRRPDQPPETFPPPPDQPDPNRAGGLERVEPPPDDAEYKRERVEDRWQLPAKLGLVDPRWYDPYHQNVLKADRPIHDDDWFLNILAESDTIMQPRRVPTPVSPQGTARPGELDIIGDGKQTFVNQNLITGLVYYKGDTVFRPPDYEYRLTLVTNYNRTEAEHNRALLINPQEGRVRTDNHVAVQELFFDKHLRDVSPRYDFDSIRIGIQPFTTDFRGFLFIDEPLGVRLFGTRDNNIFQYNLAAFRRIEKDTNSGLNDLGEDLRKDDVYVANLYWEDMPSLGYISQFSLVHNRNREGDEEAHFNKNGFIVRPSSFGLEAPRNYDVTYLGYNGDGHFGRWNLSLSLYGAYGDETRGTFVDTETDIRAGFGAVELSRDFDWLRVRGSALYASADTDPFDDVAGGFDAIFENPLFAGADTSYWISQPVPLIGGGFVTLSGINGVLNSVRSSKEEGQSNFANPGTQLIGIGADADITPEWRLTANANHLSFVDTATVEAARNQGPIDREIGWDVSVGAIYRPLFNQNIVIRASAAALVPGTGYEQLFGSGTDYSVLVNVTLRY